MAGTCIHVIFDFDYITPHAYECTRITEYALDQNLSLYCVLQEVRAQLREVARGSAVPGFGKINGLILVRLKLEKKTFFFIVYYNIFLYSFL